MQGVSEGGAGLSVTKQVNDACKHIKQSLDNLVEGVQLFNAISTGPNQVEAQIGRRGAFRKEGSVDGPEEGCKWGGVVEDRDREGSTASSSPPAISIRSKKKDNVDHHGATSVQGSDSGIHPCHATRRYSEGEGSSTGSFVPYHSGSNYSCKKGLEEGLEVGV